MRRVFLLLQLLLCPIVVSARVISYSPYTSQTAMRGYQERTTRHFVLVESPFTGFAGSLMQSEVVLYDSTGAEPPRVIFPKSGRIAINFAALYEKPGRDPVILVGTAAGEFHISRNGGRSWRQIAELDGFRKHLISDVDRGGPWTNGLAVPVRIGSGRYPFVVSFDRGIYAISATGAPKLLFGGTIRQGSLIGQNREGTEFLILGDRAELVAVTLDGKWRGVGVLAGKAYVLGGWLAPDGSAYVVRQDGYPWLDRYINGRSTTVAPRQSAGFFVPTHDFNGAWIVARDDDRITILSRYTPATGVKEMWADNDAPQVEALHTGASGDMLLIQVHRERAKQDLPLLDPALAIWRVGEPAPVVYDELFLNEAPPKGFVHLDVDKAAAGEPFVFDSSFEQPYAPPTAPVSAPIPAEGGGDVIQEWGVVRASLAQRLVIQGVTHDSRWTTDLVIYNPSDAKQKVEIEYRGRRTSIELEPKQIRVIEGALRVLFDVQEGSGALQFFPEAGINVLARVHSPSGGYVVQAVDYFNVASPRFPVSFAGAMPGPGFHAELILTDAAASGIDADVRVAATTTAVQSDPHDVVETSVTGPAIVQPLRGALIAGVRTIDDKTGDIMYFPPDIPASSIRTVPVLAHVEQSGVPALVSDLYLINLSANTRDVMIEVKTYDGYEWPRQAKYILKPYETLTIPDALTKIFGLYGIARMRYWSYNFPGDAGIRVASRLYRPAAKGGAYGTAVPPLNGFQSITGDESLVILGPLSGFRVSLGLVELSPNPRWNDVVVRVSIVDEHGKTLGSFFEDIRTSGGVLIDDVFARAKVSQPAASRIVVETLDDDGLVGAYAILTDPTTGDPTYLGAQLGAKAK